MARNAKTLIVSEIHAKADKHCHAKDCLGEDAELFATKLSYHFTTEFNHVLLQLIDILNTL